MRKNYWMVLALVLIVPAMLLSVSCAKQAVESEPAMSEEQAPMEDTQAQPEEETQPADTGPAISDEELQAHQQEQARMAAERMFTNEDVYFDFDSATLLPAAQQVLSRKADYLYANRDITVTIEGHCDERGTNAYNMALGQRRAESAKAFLVNLGINEARLSTISYGEERPVAMGHNEEAWAKNRRAHFVID